MTINKSTCDFEGDSLPVTFLTLPEKDRLAKFVISPTGTVDTSGIVVVDYPYKPISTCDFEGDSLPGIGITNPGLLKGSAGNITFMKDGAAKATMCKAAPRLLYDTPDDDYNVLYHAAASLNNELPLPINTFIQNNLMRRKRNKQFTESSLTQIMFKWQEQVSVYPPNVITFAKEKRERQVSEVSFKLYDEVHTIFGPIINEYTNSVLLLDKKIEDNSTAIAYMITEAAAFFTLIETFYSKISKVTNVQELNAYYKTFKLKPKEILTALIADIKLYSERHELGIDIAIVKDTYNGYIKHNK